MGFYILICVYKGDILNLNYSMIYFNSMYGLRLVFIVVVEGIG